MRKRLLLISVGLLLIVALVAEVMLPQVASDAVAQGMKELTSSAQVQAQVLKRPALGMIAGSFDKITVDATDAKVDKIAFSQFRATLTEVQLDRERLYFRRVVVLEQVKDVDVMAVITQEEVARYINQNVKGVKNATVIMDKGKMQVTSSFAFGGLATVAITLEGRIVGDGQKIKFVTDRFLLNNAVAGNIGGALLAEIPLVDLKKVPFGVTVRDIALEQGKLTLYADNKARI